MRFSLHTMTLISLFAAPFLVAARPKFIDDDGVSHILHAPRDPNAPGGVFRRQNPGQTTACLEADAVLKFRTTWNVMSKEHIKGAVRYR
ncbi:hypothetical protein N431DRAFT_464111 [Stipitochalara longipes BDJ]|nr:hypothetical protein N431DRAFT_464111 [Stipitochalara longipes BDJ]